jgi:hypothetical protein
MPENFNISVTRFFVCIYLLIFHNQFPNVDYDASLFHAVGIFKLLPGALSADAFLPLRILFILSLLAAAFGVRTKWSMLAAAISGTFVMAYANCFGTGIIGTALACCFLWLLCLVEFSSEKKHFVKLMQVVIVFYYFIPGIQKLRYSGMEWIFSENLAIRMYTNRMTSVAEFFLSIDPLFIRILAGSVVAIELFSPLALIGKRTAFVFVLLWASLHMGIQIVFDHHMSFLSSIPCLAIFIDWTQFKLKRIKEPSHSHR